MPRTSEDVCGYNDAARSFTLPYRRSVGAGVSELRFERRFGPEAFPSFEDFVASQPLGVYRSTNHKKSMHSVQQNVRLYCCEGLPSPFGKTCVKYKFVKTKDLQNKQRCESARRLRCSTHSSPAHLRNECKPLCRLLHWTLFASQMHPTEEETLVSPAASLAALLRHAVRDGALPRVQTITIITIIITIIIIIIIIITY